MQQSYRLSKSEKKILLLSSLGTCLEFFDFTLFSVFAIQIGKTFFPDSDPLVSTLSALGAFAAGFLMRPIGGLALGALGDKIGRKKVLSLSIFLMALPPLIVCFLPSYEKIGILAPIIILALRLLQGFSVGGEFNGAAIYVLENMESSRKAFYSSIVSASGGLGALLALSFGLILNLSIMPNESFRFAFFMGASIGLLGFVMRKTLPDEAIEEKKEEETALKPLFSLFRKHKKSMLTVFTIGALDGTLSYSLVGFLGVYVAQFLKIKLAYSFGISILSLSLYLFLTPLMANIYDRLGSKIFFRLFFIGSFLLVTCAFKLIQTKELFYILIGQSCMALTLSCFSGTQHAYMQKLFPKEVRYSGIAFSYNLGTCLLGGTSPMLLTWGLIKTENLNIPIYYICFLLCLTAVMMLIAQRKNDSKA